ncbi:cytochrome P450 [Pseudomonas chlororaphis]|uniref:cytochrome P450 n=1 Tax=Pseudomonas chlororaphis TaxID=587753 RepID=UPI00236859BD|nr:cytochrome P450 [Pseudomonas chlororaphis]WDH37686.1 cytochrome P450 [Pseudomonas chlororaphis]WDH43773.1 cytochrome P450 [Pseudomonas chlororaphis]
MDPITAVTHADPYPYYASLRARGGLAFDPGLGMWLASSAAAVAAVLAQPECRVRPAHEPVPQGIVGGAAGQVFGLLMRMNDGERQRCPRAAIEPGLQQVHDEEVSQRVAALLLGLPSDTAARLHDCQFHLPVAVVAGLLGFAAHTLPAIAGLTADFVACLSPASDRAQRDAAHRAAGQLTRRFEVLLDQPPVSPLLQRIVAGFGARDRDSLIANLIGLLSQTFEASAGLIGNTLCALLGDRRLLADLRAAPTRVADLLAEVQRHDPPVQNTRRFVAAPCSVAGVTLEPGAVVLVLLASANRDPQLNPQPDRLLLEREARRSFSFGSGRHQCPGQELALAIASAVVGALARQSTLDQTIAWTYKPSLNGRIPLFTSLPESH